MKKIAIVNQRYGLEVNGGSEYYTRLIAEHLNGHFDVEILTTCALDYMTWANVYDAGMGTVNGVKVNRFSVSKERKQHIFDNITIKVLNPQMRNDELERQWVDEQGPYCPQLIQYISEHAQEYDVFIFVTYLYYLTAVGLPMVAEKAILIPTAHDEPFLQFDLYRRIFELPRGFVFLTEEEKELVQRKFDIKDKISVLAAVGLDVPKDVNPNRFLRKYQIDYPFMIYVGRIDEGKKCDWMFRYFLEYKNRNPNSDLKLLLMGKAVIDIPDSKDIVNLGFVSDEDKYDGIAASSFMILPSEYESLSISVLEAMSLHKTVIVNGKCQVLKGHCVKSNGALYYNNFFEFEAEVQYLLTHEENKRAMEENAYNYVCENFQWNIIIDKLTGLIEAI